MDTQEAKSEYQLSKETWIAEHGSPALQAKIAAGYKCHRAYTYERAKLEYPDFYVDYADDSRWKPVDSPTDEDFAEALRVGGEVCLASDLSDPGADFYLSDDDGIPVIVVTTSTTEYANRSGGQLFLFKLGHDAGFEN